MMTRTQQQQALLAGLLVILAAVYARAFRGPASNGPSDSIETVQAAETSGEAVRGEAAHVDVAALSVPPVPAQRQAQRDQAARTDWGRDPFIAGGAGGQAIGFTLSGILWDAAAPMAIINGQMLHPGDEFEGYRVVTIGRDRVVLSDGAQTFELVISP